MKNGHLALASSKIVAFMLPHRSAFAGQSRIYLVFRWEEWIRPVWPADLLCALCGLFFQNSILRGSSTFHLAINSLSAL